MKLSQIPTSRLADTLCQLTPPMCRIACDPKTLTALDDLSGRLSAMPPLQAAAAVMEHMVPLLLSDHREDFFAVLSILTEKPVDTLLEQSGADTLRDIRQVWDRELMVFFGSAGSAEQEKS